jgi:hypothetical protein
LASLGQDLELDAGFDQRVAETLADANTVTLIGNLPAEGLEVVLSVGVLDPLVPLRSRLEGAPGECYDGPTALAGTPQCRYRTHML